MLVVAAIGVAALWLLAWPRTTVQPASDAVAQISGLGAGHLVSAEAAFGAHTVRLVEQAGGLTPVSTLPQGTKVTITAEVREPSWLSWISGKTRRSTRQIVTPAASLVEPVVVAQPGAPVQARFSRAVSEVEILAGPQRRVEHLQLPTTHVDLISRVKAGQAGTFQIAAAPEAWESLQVPVVLSYFGSMGNSTVMLTQPALRNGTVGPTETIHLAFSRPVASVFDKRMPTITPVINGALVPKGRWSEPTADSLRFTPDGPTFWPGEQYRLTLPAPTVLSAETSNGVSTNSTTATRSLEFSGSSGSTLRLQQLLAALGYLPLSWSPTAASGNPTTLTGQADLMAAPPPGTFTWRWTTLPPPFTSLWQPGTDNVIMQGAIMTFEQVSHLDSIGTANPLLWPTLIDAVLHHNLDPHQYTWIEVSQNLPETLTFYRNGAVALTSPTNTGIPQAPTAPGTYPVYLRLAFQVMRGHNPNGSAYADPVHWINYFNGSDAVHGFPRASYGFPQSVGCAELPIPTAATLWPMVHIGTLVTVLP
ncbi:MAG: L,D-transpeptidase [Acidimicrobiales bacterium]